MRSHLRSPGSFSGRHCDGRPADGVWPLKDLPEKPIVEGESVGLGAPGPTGLGCSGYGLDGPVWDMLRAGSPRLALARALGIPFAPYLINVVATFSDTTVSLVPDVGSDQKIYQDTLIRSMTYRVLNESANANQNLFQPQSDFYFSQQCGIAATLDVQGAPRYSVSPNFTLLSNMVDMIGPALFPYQWILTYQQQLFMSFQALVQLPYAPITTIVTFRAEIPIVDTVAEMTNQEAMNRLQTQFGIRLPEAYLARPGR